MKVLILCDRQSESFEGLDLAQMIRRTVEQVVGDVTVKVLDGDKIKPCVGCFQCWTRTPGLCVATDDGVNEVSAMFAQSHAVIFLSRICYGGYSPDLKAFLDRFIPNISPYFEFVGGEMHHRARYDRMPCMIPVGYGACTPDELEIFSHLAERNAINFKALLPTVLTIGRADEAIGTMRQLRDVLQREVTA